MKHPAAAGLTAGVIVLLLAGCSGPAAAGKPTVTLDAPSTTATRTPIPSPTATAGGGGDGDERAAAPTDAAPGSLIPSGDTITPTLAASAETTAAQFVTAFVRKDLSGRQWEDGYMAFLTPYSQSAYQGTVPASVPGSTVTGSPALEEAGTNTTTSAVVTVPTDAGTFTVQLVIMNTGGWLVQRALLPGAEQ